LRFIASVVLVAVTVVLNFEAKQKKVRGQLGVLQQQILLLPKIVPRVPCRAGKRYPELVFAKPSMPRS
jgi:hypothetical protein